jgi:hypothetical protein
MPLIHYRLKRGQRIQSDAKFFVIKQAALALCSDTSGKAWPLAPLSTSRKRTFPPLPNPIPRNRPALFA